MSWIAAAGKLLHKALPAGLAMKGLSKINPRIGNFIVDATTSGFAADKVLDYLRDRLSNPGALQERNRLEQQENQGNLRPDELASLNKRKEEESIGKGAGILAGIAGGVAGLGNEPQGETEEQQPQRQPPPPPNRQEQALKGAMQQKKARSMREEEEERFNQGYGNDPYERIRQELENNRRTREGK